MNANVTTSRREFQIPHSRNFSERVISIDLNCTIAVNPTVRRACQSLSMNWNCHNRLATVLFALASLLFMQFAVAAYACPLGTGAALKSAQMTAMVRSGMPCAESMSLSMDDEQPNLCQAHCQTGQQTADKYELSAPVAIGALPADFTLPVTVPVFLGAPLQAPHLKRTTAPPLAIRNCCFRL